MNIERIYIQDNFVPDPVTDPFRRKVIGIGVFVKEGESMEDAEAAAEQYIKEYIYKNTIIAHDPIETKYVTPQPLPEIQVEKEEKLIGKSLGEQIKSCSSMNVLESYRLIVKGNQHYQKIYDDTMLKLATP